MNEQIVIIEFKKRASILNRNKKIWNVNEVRRKTVTEKELKEN
jgi:hypothetical protein